MDQAAPVTLDFTATFNPFQKKVTNLLLLPPVFHIRAPQSAGCADEDGGARIKGYIQKLTDASLPQLA